MRTVYLFRHGLPEFPDGVKRCLGLTPDLPLSAAGKEEGARWTGFLKEKNICAVFSSPALRCRETAAALVGSTMPVQVCNNLHEMCYGEWEGLDFATIKTRYADLYEARGKDMSLMPPGGEPVVDAARRGCEALKALLAESEGDVAVVAHAGLNRALLWYLSGRPIGEIHSFQQDYLHLSVLEYDGGNFVIRAVNQSADAVLNEGKII